MVCDDAGRAAYCNRKREEIEAADVPITMARSNEDNNGNAREERITIAIPHEDTHIIVSLQKSVYVLTLTPSSQ